MLRFRVAGRSDVDVVSGEIILETQNLTKEFKKFREHLLQPVRFMRQHHERLRNLPLFDRPTVGEMAALEDLLVESFLVAMSSLPKTPTRQK